MTISKDKELGQLVKKVEEKVLIKVLENIWELLTISKSISAAKTITFTQKMLLNVKVLFDLKDRFTVYVLSICLKC